MFDNIDYLFILMSNGARRNLDYRAKALQIHLRGAFVLFIVPAKGNNL